MSALLPASALLAGLLTTLPFAPALLAQAVPPDARREAPAAVPSGAPADLEAAVDALVAPAMTHQKIPGCSVAIARGDTTLLQKGYGKADLEQGVSAAAHTVYRIGSITKQFTAVAILLLCERGELSLDDELNAVLPELAFPGKTVTIRHLLNHTSGIKSYTGLGPKWRERVRDDLSHQELLAMVRDEPFDFEPGEGWRYNNSGYYILGVVIEKVAGVPYDRFLEEHVYPAAGLEETCYGWEGPIVAHRAEGYTFKGGAVVNDDFLSMHQPYAAGSLLSTVRDLVRWNRALHGGKLLRAASYEQMTTPVEVPDARARGQGYGFGLAIGEVKGRRRIAHGGGIFGFSAMLGYYPDQELTVAVLLNTDKASAGALARAIERAALRSLEAKDRED